MIFLNRTDKAILSIATLLLVIFSYFLYDDSFLFPEQNQSSFASIGSIYFSEKDVRVKSSSSLSWKAARGDLIVHQKDSVFTGEDSEVAIQLYDGSVINLKENSLVTLNIKDGEMTLDLKYGDFVGQLSETSHIKVKAGQDEYQLRSEKSKNNERTVVKINKSRSGQLDVKLQGGAAAIKTKNETRSLVKDQTLALTKAGKIQEQPKPVVTLLIPHQSVMIQGKNGVPLPLRWSVEPKVPLFKVEIAKDSKFQEINWETTTKNLETLADLRAGPGQFYWRVHAASASGQILSSSQTHGFKVQRILAPIISFPEMGRPLSFELPVDTTDENMLAKFKMRWQAKDNFPRFRYQLSKEKTFASLVKEDAIKSLETESPAVPDGVYYLRVRGEASQDNFGPWSAIRPIKITIAREPRPEPPILAQKNIIFDAHEEKARSPASIPTPEITWKSQQKDLSFRVQIAKNPDFIRAKTFSTPEHKFTWADYDSGKNYYRVYAVNQRGVSSYPSDTGMVDVKLERPVIDPLNEIIVNGTDEDPIPPIYEAKVSWSEVAGTNKYILEMDEAEDDFSSPLQLEVPSTSTPLILQKPGNYLVRVKALNNDGSQRTEFSDVATLIYTFRIPLKTPLLLEPFNKTTIFMQQDSDPFFWLEWSQSPKAMGYEIQFSLSPDFDSTLMSLQTKSPRYLLKQKIPYGGIYWRVRALSENPNLNSEWTQPREFNIIFRRNEIFQ